MANPFDQFDSAPTPAPAPQQAPQQQQTSNPFDRFDTQQAPAADAQAQTAPSPAAADSTDYAHHNAVLHSMIAGGADKATIMKYATDNQLVGPHFEGDLDNALSYRARNGLKAAQAIGVVSEQSVQPQPKPIEEPKARPNGVSKGEATLVGALESIPGADRIGATVAAAGDLLPDALGGNDKSFSQNYDASLADNRALSDQSWNEHPGYYGAGYVAGTIPQLIIPGDGEASLAKTAAQGAAQAGAYSVGGTRQDLSTGEGWKNAGEQAAVDSAVGAGAGAVFHGATSLVGKMNPRAYGQDVLEAADRQGISLTPGHVSNGPISYVQRVVTDSPAGFLIRNKVNGVSNAIEDRVGQLASDASGGNGVTDLVTAAERNKDASIPGTLAAYEQSSKEAGNSLYEQARDAADGISIKPVNTSVAVNAEIARLSGNKTTNAATIQTLKDFAKDLGTKGGKSVDDLRNLRESLFNSGNYDSGTAKMLYKTLTQDIHGGLNANGASDAADLFKTADSNWRQRRQVLKVLNPLVDPAKGPEPLANTIERLAGNKGDSEKLSTILGSMGNDERSRLQAAYINDLGNATPGRSTEPGQFSFNTFLTSYNKMSDRAKDLMFRGQLGRDLADLAQVAGAQRSLARRGAATKYGALGAAGGLAFELYHDPVLGAKEAGGTLALGALLAVPGGARLLTRLAQGGKAAVPAVAKGLERIAARTPAQAAQVLGLRDALLGNNRPNTITTGNAQAPSAASTPSTDAMQFDQQGNAATFTDENGQAYDAHGNPIGGQQQQPDNSNDEQQQQ